MKLKLLALALLFSMSGCAIGPLVAHETGRSVGKDKNEFAGGFGNAGYIFKWNHGITDRIDLGVHWESLSIGVHGKYAFIDHQTDGFSLAGLAGYGSSFGGNYYQADLTASYLTGRFEPYSALRYVHVHSNPTDVHDKDTGEVLMRLNLPDYDYAQVFLGTRIWFSDQVFLSVEASAMQSLTEGLEFKSNILGGAAIGARF